MCTIRRNDDPAALRLTKAARAAWIEKAHSQRWTLFARLSWKGRISESTAQRQIEDWIVQLRARISGAAVMSGLHLDQGHLHAHALVFIPRRWYDITYPRGVEVVGWSWDAWLHWTHGKTWAEPFVASGTAHAAEYSFREVGTVMQIGTAPPSQPLR